MAKRRRKKAEDKKAENGGRPLTYDPAVHPEKAKQAALAGGTRMEIAQALGIALGTLYDWQASFPEFAEAIRTGGAPADGEVAAALHRRAVGAVTLEPVKVREETWEPFGSPPVLKKVVREKVVMVEREHPPDTKAAEVWLRNRRPDIWREVKEIQWRGSLVHQLAQLSPAQLEELEELPDEQLARMLEEGTIKGLLAPPSEGDDDAG